MNNKEKQVVPNSIYTNFLFISCYIFFYLQHFVNSAFSCRLLNSNNRNSGNIRTATQIKYVGKEYPEHVNVLQSNEEHGNGSSGVESSGVESSGVESSGRKKLRKKMNNKEKQVVIHNN